MKDFMIEPVTDPVEEARRYVRNAKDLLINNNEIDYETQLYKDRKYVRMAGNTLWNGVLLILDGVFHVKTETCRHPKFKNYQDKIAQRDHKLLDLVNVGYETIHICMGYDGIPRKNLCQEGFQIANEIIDRCALMLSKKAS